MHWTTLSAYFFQWALTAYATMHNKVKNRKQRVPCKQPCKLACHFFPLCISLCDIALQLGPSILLNRTRHVTRPQFRAQPALHTQVGTRPSTEKQNFCLKWNSSKIFTQISNNRVKENVYCQFGHVCFQFVNVQI